MQSYRIVPEIERAMRVNLQTTPEECKRVINHGTQALVASSFLEKITRITRGQASRDVMNFIRDNICKNTYVASEAFSLRFFDLTTSMDAEGVEIQIDVETKTIVYRRMTGLYGISTTTWQKEKCYG